MCAANRVAFYSTEELEVLMKDPHALARNLLELKEYFPDEDISQLVVDDIRFVDPEVVAHLPQVCEASEPSVVFEFDTHQTT